MIGQVKVSWINRDIDALIIPVADEISIGYREPAFKIKNVRIYRKDRGGFYAKIQTGHGIFNKLYGFIVRYKYKFKLWWYNV